MGRSAQPARGWEPLPAGEQRVGCGAGTLLSSLLLKGASALAVLLLFRSRGAEIMAEIAK